MQPKPISKKRIIITQTYAAYVGLTASILVFGVIGLISKSDKAQQSKLGIEILLLSYSALALVSYFIHHKYKTSLTYLTREMEPQKNSGTDNQRTHPYFALSRYFVLMIITLAFHEIMAVLVFVGYGAHFFDMKTYFALIVFPVLVNLYMFPKYSFLEKLGKEKISGPNSEERFQNRA